MGPEAEASPGGEGGYSAAMLARHVTLCLTRMRRVVREMLEARAGWSAFAAATSASALAMGVETALRSRLAPEAGVELAQDAGAVANALNAGLWMFALFALLAVLFATAWWLTARLFGRKITFLQSALGVAAGGLPQVTISAAMVACALVLSLFAEVEQRVAILMFLDYALTLPLLGYSLVAYAAATGFSLGMTLAVQLIGAVGGALLLFGLVSAGGLAFDRSLNWLVQLVLG